MTCICLLLIDRLGERIRISKESFLGRRATWWRPRMWCSWRAARLVLRLTCICVCSVRILHIIVGPLGYVNDCIYFRDKPTKQKSPVTTSASWATTSLAESYLPFTMLTAKRVSLRPHIVRQWSNWLCTPRSGFDCPTGNARNSSSGRKRASPCSTIRFDLGTK